jgi:transposase-like protein
MLPPTFRRSPLPATSAFAGFRFTAEVIVAAVRWYLRYNLSDDLARAASTSTGTASATARSYNKETTEVSGWLASLRSAFAE